MVNLSAIKQYVSLFLVLLLVLSPISVIHANDASQDDPYPADSREETISNLMSERTILQTKLSILQESIEDSSMDTNITDVKKIKEVKELLTNIQKINESLFDLGVREVTMEELAQKSEIADISPMAVVPTGYKNVHWETYRAIWVKDSVRYEVQHIVASPKGTGSSSISQSGTTVQTTNGGVRAAATGLIVTSAKEGASLIPGVDIAITLYDAIKQAITDFSSTTEVTNITSSFNWDYNMNVDFMYVKKEGQSDTSQFLSFRSSEVFGAVSWSIRNFSYKKGTQIVTATNFITGSRQYKNTPSRHKNGSSAVTAFLKSSSTAFVTKLDFTGIDGKVFKSVTLPLFSFPSQIQDS